MAQMSEVMLLGPWMSMIGRKKMGNVMSKPNQRDLLLMKKLLETGSVKPVIERRYPLAEVPSGLRYLEEGHARGKIVIVM